MSDLRKFNDECVAAHNGLRQAHKVGPLAYDDNLAKAAQAYAEKLAKMNKMVHSDSSERPNAGENLAFCFKPFVNYKYSGRGASTSWYSEIKDYDFTREEQKPGNPPTGHFTQVIWNECKQAGFGRAQSADKAWYIVGRYSPAGNFIGRYKENVPKCNYPKWEDIPVVLDYLEELRTWEFTRARKHILDDWSSETKGSIKNGVKSFTLTENFDSKIHGKYSESATFSEDPSDLPRPEYGGQNNNNNNSKKGRDAEDDYRNDAPEDEREMFMDAVIIQHNLYREKHNAPPLQLDTELCLMAQDWAETLVEKNKTEFCKYRYKDSDVGENITKKMEKISDKSGKSLVDNWYEENKSYAFDGEPQNFAEVGHFTQLIWKNSKKLGVGFQSHKNGQTYIVCLYYPPGNVNSEFDQNVQGGGSDRNRVRNKRF